jgi:hypothetical protein
MRVGQEAQAIPERVAQAEQAEPVVAWLTAAPEARAEQVVQAVQAVQAALMVEPAETVAALR